jgi:hypothetical protein
MLLANVVICFASAGQFCLSAAIAANPVAIFQPSHNRQFAIGPAAAARYDARQLREKVRQAFQPDLTVCQAGKPDVQTASLKPEITPKDWKP